MLVMNVVFVYILEEHIFYLGYDKTLKDTGTLVGI